MPSFEDLGACYPIITFIVDHLDQDDLPSFRLAALYLENRCFFEVATHRFARDFFSKVTVFMSRKSLTMLQEICAHQKFKHYITQIEFASARLARRYIKKLSSSILKAQPSNSDPIPFNNLGMSDLTQLEARYACKFARQAAVAGRPALIILTDALRNLDRKVALSISDMVFSRDTPVLGSKSFCYEMECKPENVLREQFRPGAYKLLVTATVHVGMQVDTFRMNFDELLWTADNAFDSEYGGPSQSTLKHTLPAFCLGLKKLQLRVSASVPVMWKEHLSVTQRILALASKLEVLDILFCDPIVNKNDHGFLAGVLSGFSPYPGDHKPASARNLQSLHLVGAVCIDSCINTFFTDHFNLRHIELRSCSLSHGLSLGLNWGQIFTNNIKPLRKLESLTVGDLKLDTRLHPFKPDLHAGECQCLPGIYTLNRETMDIGLDQIIQELVAHEG
ncbi:hypothetical protein BDV97DRAFT_372215 [Delphinella strobiligena]|nr:hypothetical protein BDV97DRAFT_372215 [Delphinella strobiligena]